MLYFFRLLFLLINIDQETVLTWFRVEESQTREILQTLENEHNFNGSNIEPSTSISFDTFRLIFKGLWDRIQDGLTLADIENVLFFILFIRFIILILRYNLKTSFYITCIGLFAGYLWYKHLIDLISMYRSVLLKLPFLNKLGMDAIQLRSMNRQMVLTDIKSNGNTHWYNPGQVIYSAFSKGMINIDSNTGLRYYIDPISMFVSKIQNPTDSNIVSIYYKIYTSIIPKIYDICSKFWSQLSGVAAYAIITRIGKRYCPYLIRWHWTFLLIIGMIEQIFIYFIYRVYYFQTFVVISQTKLYDSYIDSNLILQVNILNGLIAGIVLTHICFILFGLFHAIWGQYFYIPFFVENTELHIGPRPKNSIYSGGNTAWQDLEEKEKDLNRILPKFWYGWFGSGTQNKWNLQNKWVSFIIKSFKKYFRK
uniref:hypothetical chloroplast RF90 n=1 Tax=Haslea pseudostrearia TaxID=197756 RepID=UPI002208245A|nr:hypothetical chloroplast RF90 [Haslea pseudostrearia]UXN44583.1 hypothetical chloroplast RF90 [Haslea pseudostrearia]